MKFSIILSIFLISTSIFADIMTDDLGISWGMKTKEIKVLLKNELMSKYKNYNNATPERQNEIIKKVKKSIKEIVKNRIQFTEKSNKHDNAIYAGEFHYNNNESMLTIINNHKTKRYFMIKDYLWKMILVIEAENLKKNFTLTTFIQHFNHKFNRKPYKIDYDQFKIDAQIPIKVYYKDEDTLMSVNYNDIYNSFVIVYSSIKVMKKLRQQGLSAIKRQEVKLDVDIGEEVQEYDQLLYETDYTSDDDDAQTKDIFNEIDEDFNKEKEESIKRKKEKEKALKKKK